ncbi:YfhH family protein [Alteribacter natronophilus]|uniref:YfhH family protein n=1 Tax=Alteribacter natronophilus TaxID=2583810 RepID=UPI00110F69F1|nr:YfhH family protein [Alteribacter natronophilus]TMW70583.1 DUF1811 family protein [Alteribacter natronophilus]
MERRYSRMTEHELRTEIAQLKEKAQKAEQMGIVNEYAVYERKMAMAKAYLMDPDDFEPGNTYRFAGEPDQTFTISYMNGVFAWGKRRDSREEEAVPISLLEKEE